MYRSTLCLTSKLLSVSKLSRMAEGMLMGVRQHGLTQKCRSLPDRHYQMTSRRGASRRARPRRPRSLCLMVSGEADEVAGD